MQIARTMQDRSTSIALTLLGAAGTAIGAGIVVLHPKKTLDFRRLGLIQGLAAGLMLSLSFFDLIPECIETLGLPETNLWFFVGVFIFAAISTLIPEGSVETLVAQGDGEGKGGKTKTPGKKGAAKDGLTTPVRRGRSAATGAATPRSSRSKTPRGAASSASDAEKKKVAKILLSGLVTAVGLALHNAPEGMAVFLASQKNATLGVAVATGIFLHNIPEGVAVAAPVYFATKSKSTAFVLSTLSGFAEPAAAILTALLAPKNLPRAAVDRALAAVAGIMAYLSLHELLPLAVTHAGQKAASTTLFSGMALMSAAMHLANKLMGGHGH